MCGRSSSSKPGRNTTGNSRPFALCMVKSCTAPCWRSSAEEYNEVCSKKARVGVTSGSWFLVSNSVAAASSSSRFSKRASASSALDTASRNPDAKISFKAAAGESRAAFDTAER